MLLKAHCRAQAVLQFQASCPASSTCQDLKTSVHGRHCQVLEILHLLVDLCCTFADALVCWQGVLIKHCWPETSTMHTKKRIEKTTPFGVNYNEKPSIIPGCRHANQPVLMSCQYLGRTISHPARCSLCAYCCGYIIL